MIDRASLPPTDLPHGQHHDDRVRPITWSTWLAWVAAAALVPVCSTVAATVLQKLVPRDMAHRELIMCSLVVIAGATMMVAPMLQALALRRWLPRLSIALWMFSLLLSVLAWVMLEVARELYGVVLFGSRIAPADRLQLAVMSPHSDDLTTLQVACLLLLWAAVTGAVTSLVPSWSIAAASRRRGTTLLILCAAMSGACIAAVAEQLTALNGHPHAVEHWALNGVPWPERFEKLAVRAGLGGVWGAAAAIPVVAWSSRHGTVPASIFAFHRAGGRALLLSAPVLIAVLGPFVGYLAGPNGIMAGIPELRRTLSIAPWGDRSRGEPVIHYSQDVALPLAPWPDAALAPDGQTVIVRAADHMLWLVDLATGRPTRKLAESFRPSERHSLAWSPGGRYLALRSNGAMLTNPDTRYQMSQSRIRLYSWPELSLAGGFSDEHPRCGDSFAEHQMLFSADGSSLWVLCSPGTTPRQGDIMAMRLDIPTLTLHETAPFGAAAESGQSRGLMRVDGHVWAWQLPQDALPFRIHDLSTRQELLAVSPPPALIAGLTAQFARITRDASRLKYCGQPPGGPADAGPSAWICRTLTVDNRTGALIGHEDGPDDRFPEPANVRSRSVLSGHGLRIEALWQADSKSGELVVRDDATGRERQRIATIAQRPLQMSDDGRWLMTSVVDGSSLRLYRLER